MVSTGLRRSGWQMPVQRLEAGEVSVKGQKGRAVLDRNGRQIGIGDEIAAAITLLDEFTEDLPVSTARPQQLSLGLSQQIVAILHGQLGWRWRVKYARVGRDTHKAGQDQRREAKCSR